MTRSEELRRRAQFLDEERRQVAPKGAQDNGLLLCVLGRAAMQAGQQMSEVRLTWTSMPDRPPGFSLRLWNDQGAGMFPVRGVGYTVPWWQLSDFARAVADALELSIEYQQQQHQQAVEQRAARRRL